MAFCLSNVIALIVKQLFYFFLFVIVLCSCSSDSQEILSHGKMEDIIYDLHLAQGMAGKGDYDKRAMKEAEYRAAVLKKYEITQAEWDSSFTYYCRHADELHEIYNNVAERMRDEIVSLGGLCTLFISQAFIIAGQAVAMQTGLGFASLVDPVSGTNSPVVGQFFTVLCTLVFFSVDGHLIFLRLLLESFKALPMGEALPLYGIREFVIFSGSMFKAGLAMSMSAICTMLVVNFTLGVMTKAAPQLNIFSLGFAVSMIVGLSVLFLSLNAFMSNFTHNFNEVFNTACSLVGMSCEGIL